MADKKNALAELAERLKPVGNKHHTFLIDYADIEKAQRIIAELAKVGYYECLDGLIRAEPEAFNAAFRNCLAIAEEGEEK